MAEIRSFPFVRHLRAEPTAHVTLWKRGKKRRAGAGLAFWFSPLGASLAEVPLDDRELAFVFRGRSSDFQEVVVNGAVTWRVVDPDLVATRVDFSLDPKSGRYNKDPLDRLAQVVNGPAQNLAATFMSRAPLRELLDQGVEVIRRAIHDGLNADESLGAMGVEIVATAVASVAPAPELEKALQMPTRERIQQSADEATFERRALAVAKERAIQENELDNQIELARREEQLIAQRGQNDRRRAAEAAESKRIGSEADALAVRVRAGADAERTRLVSGARVEAERAKIDIYRDLPAAVLLGLAAGELAGKLKSIDHLSLAPDGLGAALQRLFGAGARRLDAEAKAP
jgi:regulator of protease activity HflC (stomatin/prohibitin superfamily)